MSRPKTIASEDRSERESSMSLRIGVLGASRIAELAIVGPAHELGHRLVAVAQHGCPLPLGTDDAVENMAYVDAAYRAAGMDPR